MSRQKEEALLELNNPARVIEINGKQFSVGLLWQPLSSPASMKEETVQFAKSEQMNLAVIYSGTTVQAGFIAAPADHIKLFTGTYSLACVLADSLGDSWVGAFELEDGNWIMLAVHDGVIVPGCDVIGSRDDIEMHLGDIASMHPWQRVYLSDLALVSSFPQDADPEQVALGELLGHKKYKRAHKIFEVRDGISKNMLMIIGALVALGMLGFGANWYWKDAKLRKQAELMVMSKAKKEARIEADKKMWQQRVEAAAEKPSWPNEPQAKDVIAVCRSAFDDMPLSLAGWPLAKASCVPGKLTAEYAFLPGTTMADFYRKVEGLRNINVINNFSVFPDKGTVEFALPEPVVRGEQELPVFNSWVVGWLSHFQMLRLNAELTLVAPKERRPVSQEAVDLLGVEGATPPLPWWQAYSWKFSTQGISVMDILGALPNEGFVVQELSVNAEGGAIWQWRASGQIYAK